MMYVIVLDNRQWSELRRRILRGMHAVVASVEEGRHRMKRLRPQSHRVAKEVIRGCRGSHDMRRDNDDGLTRDERSAHRAGDHRGSGCV